MATMSPKHPYSGKTRVKMQQYTAATTRVSQLFPDVLVQAAPRRDAEANNVYVLKAYTAVTMNPDSVKRSSQPPSLIRTVGH